MPFGVLYCYIAKCYIDLEAMQNYFKILPHGSVMSGVACEKLLVQSEVREDVIVLTIYHRQYTLCYTIYAFTSYT